VRRFGRQAQPDAQRRAYFAALNAAMLPAMKAALVSGLKGKFRSDALRSDKPSARQDKPDDLATIITAIERSYFDAWTDARFAGIVQPVAASTATLQHAQLTRQFKTGLGIEPTKNEPWLKDAIADFTESNVSLIKSIPKQFFADIEPRLAHAVSQGLRAEEIAPMIEDRYRVSRSRAALIARDQVGKFFGALNEERQGNLGITSFIWRTAMDNRVREEHEALEGKTFEWGDPPSEGIPGEAINCRCYAEPVLSDVFDALGVPTDSLEDAKAERESGSADSEDID
jgi:SPP1 gp7 family putative phage head morphogenesis protein